MQVLFNTFNFITFFNKNNITERSIFTRLFLLESIAGLPGVISAFIRHTRSLRTLTHDKDFIFTLEEEAENERMHLMICLEVYKPKIYHKILIKISQLLMLPTLYTM